MPNTQQTYPNDNQASIAGMVVSKEVMRGRYECSEDLAPGRIAEYEPTAGKLRLPQTALLPRPIGGVPYNSSLPPGGYLSGAFQVPVLRVGTMWIEYTGTAPTPESPVNVCNATDDSLSNKQHRGKVTASATATTVGAEITAVQGLRAIKVDTVNLLCLVEFNLPAS